MEELQQKIARGKVDRKLQEQLERNRGKLDAAHGEFDTLRAQLLESIASTAGDAATRMDKVLLRLAQFEMQVGGKGGWQGLMHSTLRTAVCVCGGRGWARVPETRHQHCQRCFASKSGAQPSLPSCLRLSHPYPPPHPFSNSTTRKHTPVSPPCLAPSQCCRSG